jgi:hypothetical protein
MTSPNPDAITEQPFIVSPAGPGHPYVEAWSKRRLPFEPHGPDLEFRAELRKAIATLTLTDRAVLHAAYVSSNHGHFDVENILIYNVGDNYFHRVTNAGLRFERAERTPITPNRSTTRYEHYHRYWITDRETSFQYWESGSTLAHFDASPLPSIAEAKHPTTVWKSVKKGSVILGDDALQDDAPFGLSVVVGLPGGSGISLASLVKPVLDGVVSAFHTYSGTKLSEVSTRLDAVLGIGSNDVSRMLSDTHLNVLGARQLLWPRRNGVQWNPADERIVAAEILVDHDYTDSDWKLTGRIFGVNPKSK